MIFKFAFSKYILLNCIRYFQELPLENISPKDKEKKGMAFSLSHPPLLTETGRETDVIPSKEYICEHGMLSKSIEIF